jgi:hypothetical protein
MRFSRIDSVLLLLANRLSKRLFCQFFPFLFNDRISLRNPWAFHPFVGFYPITYSVMLVLLSAGVRLTVLPGVRQPMEREVGISPRRRHGHGERGGTQWSERTGQQSNTNQQYSFRNLWSSSTSSRISLGSCARCHWHSRRPASIRLSSGAAARAALIA